MGVLAELEAGMAELSTPMRVYVAAGRFTEPEPDLPELAVRICALLAAVAADDAWRRFLPGYTPPSVPEICARSAAGLRRSGPSGRSTSSTSSAADFGTAAATRTWPCGSGRASAQCRYPAAPATR
ncbi:hypothetical protein [Streptomyces sp. B1I3]|uniref:hypothetical protein n=1 Tax=Streptomyces sp. B1I3 TaxID=3042264 RepID=UPI0027D7CB82|nr:hypothetical protein [Streptomyces sp. B1I3]